MKKTAEQMLEEASELDRQGNVEEAIRLYKEIIQMNPEWSVPFYNLGLIYKYRCEWSLSFVYNEKSAALNPEDEASWWNLGIAATALRDWKAAKLAWNFFEMELEINDEETVMDLGYTPVRLNPDEEGEVVWGRRIDPARMIIGNVPLPESGHRYGDLVLNDGAPVGYRTAGGKEYPVFNELELLRRSDFKTWSVTAFVHSPDGIDELRKLCEKVNIGFEDWSTIRILCKQCSEGVPHESHDHDIKPGKSNERRLGFGVTNRDLLQRVLERWKETTNCNYGELVMELE